MATDLEQLLEYGFEKEKAELALKHGGGLQGALDWLDKNADKSIEEIKAAAATQADIDEEPPAPKEGETAQSLVCDDCKKRFRSVEQAEFHASKSGHENFSESTEEIKPLTEEEKAAKLELMKKRLVEKRAAESEADKAARKANELIRRKATKESQDIKEDLQKKERLKEAQAVKREKEAEAEAKKRVLAKLEADKAERKRKADIEKAARQGTAPPPPAPEPAAATSSAPTTSKPASAYTETRLALQTSTGRIQKSFSVDTTLFEVAHALEEGGVVVNSFTQSFPRKVYDKTDFGMTLKEAGMIPSAALIVK
ncbi:hypothetical protein P154DRAFT_23938 [Amniculicola lignicola CBS 123094]|uniref:UBX domain-containing protein n=1 Tax=Amniculicola lignicola CBS 123094 TaxID=1392246 RepID=A0A6A5X0P8_9PLEO|nr:hypothetical protein P154DRAFT_23938 [Amniculicola lignicola CBS 123094]